VEQAKLSASVRLKSAGKSEQWRTVAEEPYHLVVKEKSRELAKRLPSFAADDMIN